MLLKGFKYHLTYFTYQVVYPFDITYKKILVYHFLALYRSLRQN